MHTTGSRLAFVCSALALFGCSVELGEQEGNLARVMHGFVPVDLARLEAHAAAYDGRRIVVVAEPRALSMCTLMACVPEGACCNRCTATFRIGRAIQLEPEREGRTFGCAGDDCTWTESCAPFPARDGGRYRLRGRFQLGEAEAKTLHVESFKAVDCQKTGCNRELCANRRADTLCASRPEYACYARAVCQAQPDGRCGFTPTRELSECLSRAQ